MQQIKDNDFENLTDLNAFDFSPEENNSDQENILPQPIESSFSFASPLNPSFLPEPLREWIVDIAERKSVPIDFAAIPAIIQAGSCIGTSCGVRPKRYDDWVETPNLWGGIVAKPSQLKTPTLTDTIKPLKLLEKAADENYKARVAEYEIALKIWQTHEKELSKGSVRKPEDKRQLRELLENPPVKPQRERFIINDATVEKIAMIAEENPKGVLLVRDELYGLLASLEKPGHDTDRAFFLEAWNGYGSYTVDRVGRGELFVKKLCLSVVGLIQPDRLVSYFLDATASGNDGLIQRFQLLVSPDSVNLPLVDKEPNKVARDRAYGIYQKLATMDFKQWAEDDLYADRLYVRFANNAQNLFDDWHQRLHTRLNNDELSPLLTEHLGKFRGLIPSLALIFYFIDAADGKLDEKCIQVVHLMKAIRFGEYLESHARKIYDQFGDQSHHLAFEVSQHILAGKLKEDFKASDVQRRNWRGLKDIATVKKTLDILADAHWLFVHYEQSTPSVGRPAAPIYRINPRVFDLPRQKSSTFN